MKKSSKLQRTKFMSRLMLAFDTGYTPSLIVYIDEEIDITLYGAFEKSIGLLNLFANHANVRL